jgi:hypothetical protein
MCEPNTVAFTVSRLESERYVRHSYEVRKNTSIMNSLTHLNITWSPTLKVRVTLIPGPGCGGGAVRKQTKHSSVWYTVEMKTQHRCSNCNYSSLQLLQMWRV